MLVSGLSSTEMTDFSNHVEIGSNWQDLLDSVWTSFKTSSELTSSHWVKSLRFMLVVSREEGIESPLVGEILSLISGVLPSWESRADRRVSNFSTKYLANLLFRVVLESPVGRIFWFLFRRALMVEYTVLLSASLNWFCSTMLSLLLSLDQCSSSSPDRFHGHVHTWFSASDVHPFFWLSLHL